MKIPKSHFSEYFKRSVVFLMKTELAVFIISIIEYLDLCTNMIDISYQIFYFNDTYNYKEISLSNIVLMISPYQYFFNYISSNNNESGFTTNFLFIIIYAVLAIWYFLYFLLISNCNLEEFNALQTLVQKISINIFDYILFRILPIYGFDVFSREIMRVCAKATSEYTVTDLLILFAALFVLGFLTILHIIYYSKISVWSNFRVVESFFTHYPYDSFFSAKCDMIFCTLKCLIALNKNYLFYNNLKVNYISEFLTVLTLVIFIGYILFIIYLFFFSYQILYFFMTGFNMLRLFLLLFMFESIAVRILLNDNNDYKSFLVFEVILLIFDIYIIFASFYNYVLSKAIKSQNYLAVCWFIQANKIDIQQFITEWIANHKTVCIDENCEICEELIKGHISLSTLEIENMEKDSENKKEKDFHFEETNQNAHNKNNSKISKDEMNINLIMKIYPPYQFNLKLINISLKLKKSLGEDDLIRLDFLYLTVLFLSNRNVEYRLFSKICNLIMQYSDNINVSVSLMLIFEIIRKSNLDLIKDYDLIKKNEDLRNSLKEYIKEYENFVHFGAKSPDNYLLISNKFREFKKLTKGIHTLFKKNLECNYQLLIMRYAYETLLHIKFKNMTPFDLGFFSDFLDYHFNGDKLFLLKYIIDRDTFTIIKGSKEVLKYQGNSLDTIFPDYLKEIGLNLFKNQLENVEKENQKPIFNFIIKDLMHNEAFGFVDSFKMKYFVYPTTMINELLLQANYINSFTNIMIFEEYEGEQILFSFSAQLYKYFGITPNMIYILKKAGMIVNFEILFPKKKNNKNKKKRNENIFLDEYSFEYKHYYPIYKKLIECDGLNDVANYLTLKDKLNEMQHMAQDNKELIFNIQQKEKFENSGIKYEIFNIKELKKKKKGYQDMKKQISTTKMDSFNESESSNGQRTGSEDDNFDMKYEGKGLNISMPTLSSASLSRQSSIRTTAARNKKDGKVDEKTKRAEKVNRYTIIILLFGCFLIGVSIVFLFMEVSENNKFKQLFQLFQTFKIFKRGIESSPLSLLSNYCYFSKTDLKVEFGNGFKCMNFYMEYSQNISDKYPDSILFKDKPIYKLIQEEIKDKYNDIITTFNDYQKAIYNLDSGVINKISEITAFSYSIKVEGNLVTLVKTDMNFISLCREYNNYITTLLEGDAYMAELFSLAQFQDTNSTLTLTVISEYEESFTQTRKIMLLMLMAYPSIHIGLQESSTIMQEEFHSSLSKIEIFLIIFFILQIILHSILILIFMMFLSVYVKMIKFNILTANKLFSDRKFLELQDKRVDQIKIMSNLYQENPNKIADKIEYIDNNYRRKTGETTQKLNRSKDTLSSQMTGYDDSVSENKSKSRSHEEKSRKKSKEFNNTLSRIGSLITSEEDEKNENNKKTIEEKSNSNGKKKNNEKNSQKNDNNEEDDEDIPLNNISQMNNVSDKIFDKITINYKFILFISLSIYTIYCVMLFIISLLGCNRLSYLVSYCEVNNEIDGYLFDNFNTLLYMYITNSSSEFYGKIIYQVNDLDYLNDGINDFYAAIQEKETIESEHSDLFPPIYDIINLDCSQGMMPDDYFENAANNLNTSYEEYFKGICEIFPVATTGNDNSMLLEVLYMIDQLAHRFENVDFGIMFNQMRNSVLFDCYTLVLTLNRIIRNYFNNYIFIDEVNKQFDYFTTLTVFYLVFNMIIEIIIFLILNFGIIYKIKFNNKLIMDFISSLKF